MRTWGGWQNIRFLLSFSLHLINLINNSYLLSVYCNCPHYTFRFHHILIRRIWPLDHNCPSASGNSLRSYEILWIPVTVTRSKLFVMCGNDSGYRRLTNGTPCHTNLSVLESYFIIALRSSPLNSPTPPFPLPFVLFLFSFSLLSNFFSFFTIFQDFESSWLLQSPVDFCSPFGLFWYPHCSCFFVFKSKCHLKNHGGNENWRDVNYYGIFAGKRCIGVSSPMDGNPTSQSF